MSYGTYALNKHLFSTKSLYYPINIYTFALLEPAKPLNDAQMCGSFFILYVKHNTFRQRIYITSRPRFFATIKRSFYFRYFEGRALLRTYRLLSSVCLYVPIAQDTKRKSFIQARCNIQQSNDAISI